MVSLNRLPWPLRRANRSPGGALPPVDVYRGLHYTTADLRQLDAYRPRGLDGPLPVVLVLPGRSTRPAASDVGHRFARAGFVCVLPRARFSDEEALAALLWTVDHVEKLGGAPDDLQVIGPSGGGTRALAAALATATPLPHPTARAVFDRRIRLRSAIVADVVPPIRPRPPLDPLQWLDTDRSPLARPLPPILALCTTRRRPLHDTRRLVSALARRGASVTFRLLPGSRAALPAGGMRRPHPDGWPTALAFARDRAAPGPHSHSIVAGGLLEMS